MRYPDEEQSTAPAAEPVTLGMLKDHARISTEADEAHIEGLLLPAARQTVENETGRQLITATWKIYLDDFLDEIVLPHPPCRIRNSHPSPRTYRLLGWVGGIPNS